MNWCACRDCMELVCAAPGRMCWECEQAGCEPNRECQREACELARRETQSDRDTWYDLDR